MANGPHMLTTFSARAAQETTRGLAARGWPRRGESAAKPTAPGAPYGAWGRQRRPLWVLECAFASPWPAARCQSTQVGAHANYFSPREDANYSLPTIQPPGKASMDSVVTRECAKLCPKTSQVLPNGRSSKKLHVLLLLDLARTSTWFVFSC